MPARCSVKPAGTLTAYANNIAGFTTAYSGAVTPAIGHNYWGTTDPSALPNRHTCG